MPNLIAVSRYCLILVLAGCGSHSARMDEVQPTLPALDPDSGRIFFYRVHRMEDPGRLHPPIILHGEYVGQFKPGAFFFLDVAPGDKEVAVGSNVEPQLRFTLQRGETRYVRGLENRWKSPRFEAGLVDNTIAEREVRETVYGGPPEALAISQERRDRLQCERRARQVTSAPARTSGPAIVGAAVVAISVGQHLAEADEIRRECLEAKGLR
jgi:hypothetical protein